MTNYFEQFRALISFIGENNYTWDDLEKVGITKDYYTALEKKHMEAVENGAVEDTAAYNMYKEEYMKLF